MPFDLYSVSLYFRSCNSVIYKVDLDLSCNCSDMLITGTVFFDSAVPVFISMWAAAGDLQSKVNKICLLLVLCLFKQLL